MEYGSRQVAAARQVWPVPTSLAAAVVPAALASTGLQVARSLLRAGRHASRRARLRGASVMHGPASAAHAASGTRSRQ